MTWSLRRRLSVAAAASAAALVLVVGLLGLSETWRRDNAERAQNVDLVSDRIDRALFDNDPDLDALLDDDQFVALFDVDGFVTDVVGDVEAIDVEDYASEEIGVPFIALDELIISTFDDGHEWSVAAIRCSAEDRCDSLVVGSRDEPWTGFMASRLPWGLAVLALVTAVAGLGARWLVGRSLQPVDHMRRTMDDITEADLEGRVEVPPTGDELADLGTSMNATVDRLADAINAQRRFVSDSAHELRSPLAGLRATLELAEADPTRSPTAVTEAIGQVDRTTALVDDLLELARRDAGVRRARSLADIDDLLRLELRAARARWPQVEIVRGHVTPVQAEVDGRAITRVIRNLVDNGAGHGRSTVAVSLHATDTHWVLTVDDDGPGIAPDQRAQVFDRFRRLDESRSRDTGGSGLGLAIVAGIVADHGGTVQIGQAELGGARFQVSVPRA